MTKPRYRLATDAALSTNAQVNLRDNAAHYLAQVLRLKTGDSIALFNREQGEWCAVVEYIRKKEMSLRIMELLRAPEPRRFELTVCFAPIKGGRLETIIEKATELGATALQPVITHRTIVDKVNRERGEAIAREAAEQCERIDWPEIREPVKLMKLLGDWPKDLPLIYGDESGDGVSISQYVTPSNDGVQLVKKRDPGVAAQTGMTAWAVLVGPEGGFTPEEFAALKHVKAAHGVGLGPRILRADTAVITLCTATLLAWGDWDQPPRFVAAGE